MWDGVRNARARNFMRSMKQGDRVVIYHSSCKPPGVAGFATISKPHYPDPTALNPKSKYYDEKSTSANNRWSVVDVTYASTAKRFVPLDVIKATPSLSGMLLLRCARLSVMSISALEYDTLVKLAGSA